MLVLTVFLFRSMAEVNPSTKRLLGLIKS